MQGGIQKITLRMDPRQEACLIAKLKLLDEEERRLAEMVFAIRQKTNQCDKNKPLEIAQLEGRHEVAQKELEAVQSQREDLVKNIRGSA